MPERRPAPGPATAISHRPTAALGRRPAGSPASAWRGPVSPHRRRREAADPVRPLVAHSPTISVLMGRLVRRTGPAPRLLHGDSSQQPPRRGGRVTCRPATARRPGPAGAGAVTPRTADRLPGPVRGNRRRPGGVGLRLRSGRAPDRATDNRAGDRRHGLAPGSFHGDRLLPRVSEPDRSCTGHPQDREIASRASPSPVSSRGRGRSSAQAAVRARSGRCGSRTA